ncbi:transporter substrate-binding domain-containing protein [Streptomyces sp. P38-E01]|uniref:Transporter substrate-binding domain-containing protein n=1 Tax=Streptomyces tardus TaxID=2780544 RepID=A0A949JKV6_9ACTN|nr:transporter substrate-binding domain-containing protein [Streptomyces tardus]MBU7598074.1 transporter substrate-binding domain-containing protein [Streptomyces tardus]
MRPGRPRLPLAGCLLLALGSVSACGTPGGGNKEAREAGVFVGVKTDQPGTGYGKGGYAPYEGFDIRISRMATEALGRKPDFKPVKSEDRVEELKGERSIRLVVATYSINNERLADHDFVGPYANTYQGFLVRKDESEIKNLDDLKGEKVCTWSGSTSTAAIVQEETKMVRVPGSTATECLTELQEGRVRAVSTDQLILYGFSEAYKDLEVVPDVTIRDEQRYGIGLPKGYRDECRKIKERLKEYVTSGDWARDFKEELPAVARAEPRDWESNHIPTESQIESFSCKDKIS